MISPAVCTSCGRSLGQYTPLYRKIRENRTKKKLGDTIPQYASMEAKLDVKMGDVLDNMGIKMECCRMLITTDVPLRDVY